MPMYIYVVCKIGVFFDYGCQAFGEAGGASDGCIQVNVSWIAQTPGFI